jgi:flagellar assembly factor FliW
MEKIITNSDSKQEYLTIETTRFGSLKYLEKELVVFYKGLFGFDNLHQFILIERENSRPFVWLQSVENPSVAFPIVDPILFKADYKIEVQTGELEDIDIREPSQARTFVIATIPSGKPEDISLNLLGPIVINVDSRQAVQLALSNSSYSTKYYLVKESDMLIESKEKQIEVVEV